MPTGYTADVVDGKIVSLRDFALLCARGMGALITMRDDPFDAPIPERFEPSDYHTQKLEAVRAERQRLYNMTNAEAEAAARAEFDEKVAAKAQWEAGKVETRNRYNAMIAKVVQWEGAPEGLKEFMLEQLRSGRDFDCPDRDTYWDEPVEKTGAEWRGDRLAKVQREIEYHAVEGAKERERTEGRNAWIAQLRASLPASVDTHPSGGDAIAAPFMSGAVPSEETADAQPPAQPIGEQPQ
jgi:hypothetical protein